MENPIEWTDHPHRSRTRTVRTAEELLIPGLKMFGRHIMTNAVSPLPSHYHKSAYEFTFVINGALSFTTGGRSYELTGCDVFMTRPDEVHSTNLLPLSAGEIIWFQLDLTEAERLFFLEPEAVRHFLSLLDSLQGPCFPAGNKVFSLVTHAFELSAAKDARYQCAACLVLTLYELSALSRKTDRSVTPDIESALDYIKSHITSEISLEMLADFSHLSVSQLKQKFKAQVGVAPRHYINYRKVQAAKKMLLEGASVTSVAMSLGFNSSSYFAVVFKRYNACSPTEYVQHKEKPLPEYFPDGG